MESTRQRSITSTPKRRKSISSVSIFAAPDRWQRWQTFLMSIRRSSASPAPPHLRGSVVSRAVRGFSQLVRSSFWSFCEASPRIGPNRFALCSRRLQVRSALVQVAAEIQPWSGFPRAREELLSLLCESCTEGPPLHLSNLEGSGPLRGLGGCSQAAGSVIRSAGDVGAKLFAVSCRCRCPSRRALQPLDLGLSQCKQAMSVSKSAPEAACPSCGMLTASRQRFDQIHGGFDAGEVSSVGR